LLFDQGLRYAFLDRGDSSPALPNFHPLISRKRNITGMRASQFLKFIKALLKNNKLCFSFEIKICADFFIEMSWTIF
jgi:hypothetical protein